MGFDTGGGGGLQSSSDVDHQKTTNRTHSGDSITPSSVDTDDETINNKVTYPSGAAITTNPSAVDFEEDGNSPFTATGQNSITATLAESYNYLLAFVEIVDNSGTGNNPDVQVNGDTGANYTYRDNSASQTSGASSWEAIAGMSDNSTVRLPFIFREGPGRVTMQALGLDGGTIFWAGKNGNVSPPINSITIKRGVSTDFTVELYGRNTP